MDQYENAAVHEVLVQIRKKLIADVRAMLKPRPEGGDATAVMKSYASGWNDACEQFLKRIEGR